MIISNKDQIAAFLGERNLTGMFIMDFDGTLLRSDRNFADNDLRALKQLGEKGIIRAIATGRSLYSFNTVAVENLPVDFVMFSTGAGVLEQSSQKIIRKVSLESSEVERACDVLRSVHLDFMVHRTIPDNHVFAYYQSKDGNADFERRLTLYSQFATPLSKLPEGFGPATQLVAVVPVKQGNMVLEKIRSELSDFNVIQTTSPLDGISTWIEIFPRVVSKSLTAAWLAEKLGIDNAQIASVGNDYNDLDLLEWAANSYVVDNAPEDLKARFPNVASNNNGGVAEAIQQWRHRKSV
ncbi:MAG: HAD hydrolase family protein [Desulfobacterales bacterium]|jgi:hypothetical protein